MHAPFYRGRFDRRGPRSGGLTPRGDLMHAIAQTSQALAWWPADAQFVHLTSGNVDTWTDYVGGKTLTDQGVSGNRPPWDGSDPNKPFLDFSSGSNVLAGASNLLSGRTDVTLVLVGEIIAPAAYGFLVAYDSAAGGTANGRCVLFIDSGTNRIENFLEKDTTTYNGWYTNNAFDTGRHVWVARQKFGDGTAAAKAIREDGADLAGSYQYTGDVSGGSYSTYLVAVGASSGGVNPAKLKVNDVLIAPYLDDATSDAVYQMFRQLRALP
jgi:hypothetical protein